MQRHARGYSDDELRAIAAEFARQDPEREKK
jgi:cytochrome c553